MRHRATALVIGAVVVLVGAAVVDAIRTADGSEPPTPTAPQADAPADSPPPVGLSGVLYLTVRSGAGCEYRAFAFPDLDLVARGPLSTCRFQVSPDAEHVAEFSECPPGRARIRFTSDPAIAGTFTGCAPAWRLPRRFTFVSDGAVVAARRLECLGAADCLDVIVSKTALTRGLALLESGRGSPTVVQIAWVSGSRLAVLARTGPRAESIVFFDDGQPSDVAEGPFPPHSQIEVVMNGAELLVGGRGRGFVSLNSEEAVVSHDRVPWDDAAAVAESPDREWLALAQPGQVCIYARPQSDDPEVCFPADAQDLAWR
jgi:hypothetical protein